MCAGPLPRITFHRFTKNVSAIATTGTVNPNNIITAGGSIVRCNKVDVASVAKCEANASARIHTVAEPNNSAVAEKLDHLANAVSTINSKVGIMGSDVQELKAKSNTSRAWDDAMNLSRVGAGQEPLV